MSTLLLIWIISAFIVASIMLYARFALRPRNTLAHAATRFSDLVADEIALLNRDFYKLLEHAKPHGRRSLSAGLVMVKRGQDLFISRVYGRMQSEKGRASSFFLKQIKEEQGNDMGRKEGARKM